MKKNKLKLIVTCVFLFAMAASCDKGTFPFSSDEEGGEIDTEGSENTVDDTKSENSGNHDDEGDYTWDDNDIAQITLNGTSIQSKASGVSINGSTVTITSSGTYKLDGSLSNGQIIVDTDDDEIVRLIFNGVDITNTSGAPVYIKNAAKAMIVLAEGTDNSVIDGTDYVFDEDDEPNATIFSKENLTFYGNGSLTVKSNYNDGVSSKDGLIIASGIFSINSIDDGIRGKDYLIVKEANITIDAGGDGLKSDNDEDETKGYIQVEYCTLNITSGGDGITAETDVMISDGEIKVTSGGGSTNSYNQTTSMKGIKAGVELVIDDGVFSIYSADDAMHSNKSLAINGGFFLISSGDDGIHADAALGINGGEIDITKSYEGIESAVITINYGDINIISSDDGLNVAGGNDGSGMGRQGQGDFSSSGSYYIYLNDGHIVIDADGDGIDSNGSIEMTGGNVIINGPTSSHNGALDYNSSFKITGGFLLAAGSSGMAQAPSSSSKQYSILLNYRSTIQAGTLTHIQKNSGDNILTFAPSKTYQSVVFSSPNLTNGTSYNVYTGGSSTGTITNGLYEGGTYTPGSQYTSFTISGTVTRVDSSR